MESDLNTETENKYCVYFHKKVDTAEVFYVGIGNSKRPYVKKGRSGFWKNVVKKHGLIVEIVHENLTWIAACNFERNYIKQYGRADLGAGILVNFTNGGDGRAGAILSEEQKQKISVTQKKLAQAPEYEERSKKRKEKLKIFWNSEAGLLKRNEMRETSKKLMTPEMKSILKEKSNSYWSSPKGKEKIIEYKELNKTRMGANKYIKLTEQETKVVDIEINQNNRKKESQLILNETQRKKMIQEKLKTLMDSPKFKEKELRLKKPAKKL